MPIFKLAFSTLGITGIVATGTGIWHLSNIPPVQAQTKQEDNTKKCFEICADESKENLEEDCLECFCSFFLL